MAKTCCGAERTTPFCPSCGAPLGQPGPLVTLLKYLKKQLTKAEKPFEGIKQESAGNIGGREYWWSPTRGRVSETDHEKWRRERDKWRGWCDAVEQAIAADGTPKMACDWLQDNGFPEAAAALLGSFTGKQL